MWLALTLDSFCRQLQLESTLCVETAYSECLAEANAALSLWHSRIAQGKIVEQFGARAGNLLKLIQSDYNARTVGSVCARTRGERYLQLREHVASHVALLRRQQTALIATEVKIGLKRQLVALLRAGSYASAAAGLEEFGQVARKAALSDFDRQVEYLQSDQMASAGTERQQLQLFARELQQMLDAFPESPGANLEQTRRLLRHSKSSSDRKAPHSSAMQVSMSLVGMLKPPGKGNLHALVSYGSRLLGLPLELTLGVLNDGESMEVSWTSMFFFV